MKYGYGIPKEILQQLFAESKKCAYCKKAMLIPYDSHNRKDSATIEHLRYEGPFYWHDGLKLEDVVLVCGSCNSSRGIKPLSLWFTTAYCQNNHISADSVVNKVKDFLRKIGEDS